MGKKLEILISPSNRKKNWGKDICFLMTHTVETEYIHIIDFCIFIEIVPWKYKEFKH